MKKVNGMKSCTIILLLICTLTSLLCGCSLNEDSSNNENKKLATLTIGIDSNYEPYSYIDESGNFAGLDIELATEACRRMNVEPVFMSIKWNYKDEYLADGSIDCVWSCFSMNGREEDYNWVGPYMYSRQVIAVRSDSDIESFEDLNGKTVAVMSSTKPEAVFLEAEDSHVPDVEYVYSMEDMNLVFSALQLGYVDASAGHETVMRQYIETATGNFRLLDEDLLSARVGIAFAKDSESSMRDELEKVMNEMKNDGTLGKILEEYGISAQDIDGGDSE